MDKIMEKFNDLTEELLILTTENQYIDEIKHAHDVFMQGLPEDTVEIGFNQWLIFDYFFRNGSTFINELYKRKPENSDDINYLKALEQSTFSVFQIHEGNKQSFLKEIFTKNDYKIENSISQHSSPLIARVVTLNRKHYLLNTVDIWQESSIKSIRQSILKKYNEVHNTDKSITIERFIKEYSMVLYKYLMIYKDAEIKSVFEDEEFYVYQSLYQLKKKKDFNDIVNESNVIKFQTDEYENKIFELYDGGLVVAEIELIKDQFNVECKNQEDLDLANELLADIFDDSIVKIKDEILNIEDLISGR